MLGNGTAVEFAVTVCTLHLLKTRGPSSPGAAERGSDWSYEALLNDACNALPLHTCMGNGCLLVTLACKRYS